MDHTQSEHFTFCLWILQREAFQNDRRVRPYHKRQVRGGWQRLLKDSENFSDRITQSRRHARHAGHCYADAGARKIPFVWWIKVAGALHHLGKQEAWQLVSYGIPTERFSCQVVGWLRINCFFRVLLQAQVHTLASSFFFLCQGRTAAGGLTAKEKGKRRKNL